MQRDIGKKRERDRGRDGERKRKKYKEGRKRERKRESDRQTDKQTDRQMIRQTYRENRNNTARKNTLALKAFDTTSILRQLMVSIDVRGRPRFVRKYIVSLRRDINIFLPISLDPSYL